MTMADRHFVSHVQSFLKQCQVSTDFPRDNSLLVGGVVLMLFSGYLSLAEKIGYGYGIVGFYTGVLFLGIGMVRNSWGRIMYPFDLAGVEDMVAKFSTEEINAFKRIMNYIEERDTDACTYELQQLSRYVHMKEWPCAQILYNCFVAHKQKFSFGPEAGIKNQMNRYPF